MKPVTQECVLEGFLEARQSAQKHERQRGAKEEKDSREERIGYR